MNTKSPDKYCFLEPNFPKEAFVIVLFFSSEQIPLMIFPLSDVVQSEDEASQKIANFIQDLEKSGNKTKAVIQEKAILLPITFEKLFPLKKEYWTKSKLDADLKDKISAFVPIVEKLPFHKLLVVPVGYLGKEKQFELCVAYPFSIFAENSEIEKFMFGSSQKVDIKAKSAALYLFGEPKKLNWKTGEVSEIEKPNSQKPEIIN